MLSEQDVKALLVMRMLVTSESDHPISQAHSMGQVRALVSVLNDGEPPPIFDDAREIMNSVGIPFVENPDGTFNFDRKWVEDHGFKIIHGSNKNEDKFTHEKFGPW